MTRMVTPIHGSELDAWLAAASAVPPYEGPVSANESVEEPEQLGNEADSDYAADRWDEANDRAFWGGAA